MSEEPKPCPFCGGPGKIIHPMGEWTERGYGPEGSRVVCAGLYENRECPGRAIFYSENQDAEAVTAWNVRADHIEALTAERNALREVLAPFADVGEYVKLETEGFIGDEKLALTYNGHEVFDTLEFDDFLRAANTLSPKDMGEAL